MLPTAVNFSRKVDWNLLKTFHEIAEAGGVSRAGRALRRKQPALSLALKRLESELGVTLCRRGPRGFELTDEGMLVAETCRSLNALVRNVPKRLGNSIDRVMHALMDRGVEKVYWINLSERHPAAGGRTAYGTSNDAIRKAGQRWGSKLTVLDWNSASSGMSICLPSAKTKSGFSLRQRRLKSTSPSQPKRAASVCTTNGSGSEIPASSTPGTSRKGTM